MPQYGCFLIFLQIYLATVLVVAYTVQPGDGDTDGIYIGADPLGDNAGIDFHAEDTPAIPAYLRLAENQLAASQSVDGSSPRTCEEVFCSTVLSGGNIDPGFSLYYRASNYPFLIFGESSAWSFEYGGEEGVVVHVIVAQDDDVLELELLNGLSGSVQPRLALSVDETVFPLSEADYGSRGYFFGWDNPGLTWAVDDEIAVKLIETATATFDAASYAKAEGDNFDVTVTLGDTFENTLTLPLVVTGNGGATELDYSISLEELVFAPGDTSKTFTVTIVDDTRDDDGESLTLSFGEENHIKSGGTNETATITITDNDDPEVNFQANPNTVPGEGTQTVAVAEGDTQTVTVTLTSAAGSAVTIPITETPQGGASSADYSGVPASLTFSTGETSKTISFTATQDTEDDDGESVLLALGMLPSGVQAGTANQFTFNITDDDDPQVTVSFGADAYTVAEGGMQAMTVTLSADPERTVTIPITATPQGGASSDDYSGVPADVTFNAGDTSMPFSFMATQDAEDDDNEGVLLAFGTPLPSGVSPGTTNQVTFNITDDDDPQVTVSFGQAAYTVAEGETVTVRVTLNADPERMVTIPITETHQGEASSADYSGVPANLNFSTGETLKTISFTATQDTEDEDGESVRLTFGTLPGGVQAGTIAAATVSIGDDCGDVDILCTTATFGAEVHWEGRYDLHTGDVDNTEFSHNGQDYQLWSISMVQNGSNAGDDNHVVLPFGIPERTHFLIDFFNLKGTGHDFFEPPNDDWLDWTLHITTVKDGETLTAALRFSEARKLAGAWWRWSGRDIDDLRRAWTGDQTYKLRLVNDPREQRTPQPLNPPLYLRAQGEVNTTQTWLRWLTPQTRYDRLPLVDSYKIQWKPSSGSWETPTEVTEFTRGPTTNRSMSHFLDGLTPGVEHNIRVIATDSVGDSEPSNEITYAKPAAAQQSLSNTPAEEEPRVDGIPEVGQTLSADTTTIADADGLENAVFQYQWLADDADIAGATGASYTVVSEDAGKAIRVRVTFTDDGGNEETLTSAPTVVTAAGLQLQSATVDGSILTLTYSEVLDTGVTLGTSAFAVSVNGSSRSLIGVAVGESNVLLLLSTAVEAGDTVTVGYTVPDGPDFIRDIRGRKAASFSGQAVTNGAASTALKARAHNVPSSHNGEDAFTFELRFSEEPRSDLSDTTLRDHAFTVAGGSVNNVRRLEPGQNVRWEITVLPDSSADVVMALNATTDCSADGAICTEDGGKLSGGLQVVVPWPNTPPTGLPTIAGTAQVGETLTADTAGISDGDGLTGATYTYQWLADDAEINGATAATYTLADADVGKAIRVKVTFTDDEGNAESLTSAATASVAARPNSQATGAPTISGTVQAGEALTASTSGIADDDGLTNVTYSYQWVRNDGSSDTDILGATDSTYTLVAADQGKTIKVKVSFTDDADNEETLTSTATAEVAAGAPADPPGQPRNLTGVANSDGTVTLSWEAPNDGTVTGYQILRRRPSEGENTLLVHVNDTRNTATEYTDSAVTPAVLHAYRVKAINAVGLSSQSNFVNVTPGQPTEPAQNSPATGTPQISGTAQVGETLTASTSHIADSDGLNNAAFSYRWIRNDGSTDTDIQDATGASHTLVDADEGRTIKVEVNFADDAGNAETLTSAATTSVAARPNSPATGAPTISGTAQVGERLTADIAGISDGDGLDDAAFAHQWLADGAEINGATAATYTLVAADAGKAIKVQVSFTDDAGNDEEITSAATAAVAEAEPAGPPPEPRNLTAVVNGDGHVVLSWEAPEDDSITGYQILRRRPTEGEDTLLVYVEDTQSTATTYTDTNVTAGVQHAYRVRAINAAGASPVSNFVDPTP